MQVLRLENERISIEVAPEVGGRIIRFIDRESGYDYLWRNAAVPLRKELPGAEYDPNFFGGIEELLPNDVPETIDGIACPDHGELWTLELSVSQVGRELELSGDLPCFGLQIRKRLRLEGSALVVETEISNPTGERRNFLWKLHAALNISAGDEIGCDAETWNAVDPQWSRRRGQGDWFGEVVPETDGTTEFLYLTGLRSGVMSWTNGQRVFKVKFDPLVFRYAWYFASYGGFDGHEVAILEPCTSMPLSVNEAAELGQCPCLEPGQKLRTEYRYMAVQ